MLEPELDLDSLSMINIETSDMDSHMDSSQEPKEEKLNQSGKGKDKQGVMCLVKLKNSVQQEF